eukprot:m.205176 g.205176  ORF g.205176 m.205176 type:complete len:492 (+) comp13746_c1_seq3:93-1568(+)
MMFQEKYGDLDSTVLSFGPCQTPTLSLCVQRYDRIQSFNPETYYTVDVRVALKNGSTKLSWQRVRVFDRTTASFFLDRVKDESVALVTKVSKKQKSKPRPTALNTVELLRVCSSGLGIGPQAAMSTAERLYMQGFISYPRTETTAYPKNFDLVGVLKQQQHSEIWGEEVKALLSGDMVKPKGGVDHGDHPPITPMRVASDVDLGGDMWRVYDLITRHFIATLSPDCKYESTDVTLSVGKELFSLTGSRLLRPGFTAVMTWLAPNEDVAVPSLSEGEELAVKQAEITERKTSPPGYLTESELITLMEKHGIGTDASIPKHINTICERNYVQIAGGRTLQPTNLGVVIIHGYQNIDFDLCLPTMRAAVEKQLGLIAKGHADYSDVLYYFTELFRRKFVYFRDNINLMDQLFELSFTPLASTGKNFTLCGKCKRYMKYVSARPQRLFCPICDETYSLPQGGKIMIYKGLTCPLDKFELVLFSTGQNGKSYPLCP